MEESDDHILELKEGGPIASNWSELSFLIGQEGLSLSFDRFKKTHQLLTFEPWSLMDHMVNNTFIHKVPNSSIQFFGVALI